MDSAPSEAVRRYPSIVSGPHPNAVVETENLNCSNIGR